MAASNQAKTRGDLVPRRSIRIAQRPLHGLRTARGPGATSTLVSVASLASLAWKSSSSASRMVRRWVVRPPKTYYKGGRIALATTVTAKTR